MVHLQPMKLCLAVYGQRLASLFDNAPELRMYHYQDGHLSEAGEVRIPHEGVTARLSALSTCGVDTLICGAVSGCTKQMLHQSGIQVWDWIRGDVDKVLQAWQEGKLSEWSMPGCRKKGCCKGQDSMEKNQSNQNSVVNTSPRRRS